MLCAADTSLVAQGLGQIGDYLNIDELWSSVVPQNFEEKVEGLEVRLAPRASIHDPAITPMVPWLLYHQGVSVLLSIHP